jgi:hypothetical protein
MLLQELVHTPWMAEREIRVAAREIDRGAIALFAVAAML